MLEYIPPTPAMSNTVARSTGPVRCTHVGVLNATPHFEFGSTCAVWSTSELRTKSHENCNRSRNASPWHSRCAGTTRVQSLHLCCAQHLRSLAPHLPLWWCSFFQRLLELCFASSSECTVDGRGIPSSFWVLRTSASCEYICRSTHCMLRPRSQSMPHQFLL